MEFQVYAVHLEDRYPPALPEDYTGRDELMSPGFHDALIADPPSLEKQVDGCVAFVFGRTADGRSVCVRVEEVRPRLYFTKQEGDTLPAVKRELEQEVRMQLRDTLGLRVQAERFAHFYGYEPCAASPSGRCVHDYLQVSYPSLYAWRAACKLRREEEGKEKVPCRVAHEAFVDPTTRFLVDAGITPGGWTRVPTQEAAPRVTTCDVELECSLKNFESIARDLNAPYVVCYYDIETLGLDPEQAPIIQVSLVFVKGGVVDKHLVAVGTVAPLSDVTVHTVNTEAELLRATRGVLVRHDPDFVVAYNGVNFDNRFLDARATRLGVKEFGFLSRFALRPSRLRELMLNSSGMGDNTLRYFDMVGRANVDWFQKLKLEHTSEPSYKLSHFAQKFCGDDKEDMHYSEIPVLQAGTAEDRARLGSYCVHDSLLLHRLDEALTLLVGILQFSQVFGIVPEWVHFRGQQVRFVAQLLAKVRVCEAVPMLLQTPAEGLSGQGETSFEGATVNEPKKGFYKVPVVTLDWKSLYPSLMMAHNTCHSTLVRDPRLFGAAGVVAHTVREGRTNHFATQHKGVLPLILRELLDERGRAKKQVKTHTKAAKDAALADAERARHAVLAKVFDGRQLALKVSANSIYGACGATTAGKYYCKAVSETVTYEGRQAMVTKKEILPQRFPGIDVIYGDTDSVMVVFADVTDVQEALRLGDEAADFVTEEFARRGYPDMVLENEKAFFPYLLFKKKRYIGLKYEPAGDGTVVCKGIDAAGVETERKDTLPFLKDIYYDVRDALIMHIDPQMALQRLQTHLDVLVRGDVPFEKLVLSKSLSASYANADGIVQARVNKLRRQRDPGSEFAPGERVPYVILEGKTTKDKTTDLAECAEHARRHKLTLNGMWYLDHMIVNPMKTLFDVVEDVDVLPTFAKTRGALERKRLGGGEGMRTFMAASSSSSATASLASSATPTARHVPRPPAPRKRARK